MRATSIFTLSLLASALALPGAAQALGLGTLTVDSALGQPLSAKIALTSATRDEIDTLKARIAAPALYAQNNLNYQAALARARVSVETGPDGQPYLRVTSPGSVLEPYLDLLVEVDWSAGRVVRDYTLLLDPPDTGTQMAEPVAPARGGATTRAARAPATAPAPTANTSAAAAPAPGEGYTVKRGDTLAKIANETKSADVTLDQMLVALFKANGAAFVSNNMNRLRAGAILTVPSADQVNAETPTDAQKTVHVQAVDWRAYRDRLAAAAPESGGEASRSASGSIGTAVDEKTPAAQAGRDQLKVSRDAQGKSGTGAAEDKIAGDGQLREAQARVAQLEKMLADSQHAVELKNSTMASMQNQADASKGKAPAAPAVTQPAPTALAAATPSTTSPASPATLPAAVPASPVSPPVTASTTATPTTTTPITTPPAPDTTATPATPIAGAPASPAVDAPKPVPAPKPAAPKPAVKRPVPEPSLIDQITDAIPAWALGGAVVLILGLIAFVVAQRRRKTTKFEDSIISGTDIKTNTVFGSTGGGVVNTGDNSLASDFSRESLGNIDTDEVDPIAEAEVYLAYGRDAQAEEILKDALKKDPQRQEIYLKLLEIHAQHNKPSAFETVAAELYAQCQGQGETWQKAVALGRQLDPNNPMFAEGSAVPLPRPAGDSATDAELFTMGPDLTLPPKNMGAADSIMLDEPITHAPMIRPKTPADILAGADRALEKSSKAPADIVDSTTSAIAAGYAAAAAAGAAGAAAAASAGQSVADKIESTRAKMDLDFHLDDREKPPPPRTPVQPEHEMAGSGASTSTASDRLARPAAAMELDKLDLSFDPDKATFEDPTPSVLDGQWHDAATKLDLAKAYQEMGDVEGAREILQEVLHEGDDQQKTEAKALLAKLG